MLLPIIGGDLAPGAGTVAGSRSVALETPPRGPDEVLLLDEPSENLDVLSAEDG
jgi:hypothetical protein